MVPTLPACSYSAGDGKPRDAPLSSLLAHTFPLLPLGALSPVQEHSVSIYEARGPQGL